MSSNTKLSNTKKHSGIFQPVSAIQTDLEAAFCEFDVSDAVLK